MRPARAPGRHAPALDGLRVAAAALVLLSHARALLLRDAEPGLPVPAALFMGLSGLGHQAVIVFFVLSGLLVTGSMLRLADTGRWSLATFAAARLTRLWVVLLPCLLLGAALDGLGLALAEPGQPYGIPPLGHRAVTPALGPAVALGNLAFLQTIAVPVLGSNGPLWSLANEFWYYVIAALGFAAWRAGRRTRRAVLVAAALLVCAALPRSILALAPVWGGGAAVALLGGLAPAAAATLRRPAALVGGALVVLVLPASRLHWGLGALTADLALGAGVAALLLALPEPRNVAGRAAAWLRGFADATYSVYLSHLPVLAFVAALAVGPRRLPLEPRGFVLLGAALLLALGVGWAVWWGFERHTAAVRAALRARAPRLPAATRPVLP